MTRSFASIVEARLARDPGFREALLRESVETMLTGDMETGKAALRGYSKPRSVSRFLAKASARLRKARSACSGRRETRMPAISSRFSAVCRSRPAFGCTLQAKRRTRTAGNPPQALPAGGSERRAAGSIGRGIGALERRAAHVREGHDGDFRVDRAGETRRAVVDGRQRLPGDGADRQPDHRPRMSDNHLGAAQARRGADRKHRRFPTARRRLRAQRLGRNERRAYRPRRTA